MRTSLPEYYARAVVAHDVDVIDSPEIEITEGQESGAVCFDAVVEVRPCVQLTGYRDLRVEIPDPKVDPGKVEDEIDLLRSQFAEFSPLQRPAVDGDHVTIDIVGKLAGSEIAGLTTSDYDYEVGSGAVVDEIDQNLRGARPGDICEFEANHPDPEEDQTLHFRVLVKDVKEAVLPDLDDDFVAENTEHDSVAALRDAIMERFAAMNILQSRLLRRGRTLEALAGLVDSDVPVPMVDSEIDARVIELLDSVRRQGMDVDDYLAENGQTIEELAEKFRDPALAAVKVDLALRAVAAAEDLAADDADLAGELQRLAAESSVSVDELEERLASNGRLSALRAELGKRAAFEWLTGSIEYITPSGGLVDAADLELLSGDADDEAARSDEDS